MALGLWLGRCGAGKRRAEKTVEYVLLRQLGQE